MKDDLDTFEAACRAADGEATVDNHLSEPDEIARLAKLPKLEYDRQRDEAAARLGVRVATLDKRVLRPRAYGHVQSAGYGLNTDAFDP
jgi:hypothetical protein